MFVYNIMELKTEILSILKHTPDVFPINHTELKDITSWLHMTLIQYNNPKKVTYDIVETTFLGCLKKIYYVDDNDVELDIVLCESHTEQVITKAISDKIYSTLSKHYKKVVDKLNYLLSIPQPPQKSKKWFEMRKSMITASDGGAALGEDDHHKKMFDFILKKCGIGDKFEDNVHTYHGKKYERVAILVYEQRNDIQLLDFGLLKHRTINFLGASPDSICNILTLINELSLLGGRMVEIKCPTLREILTEGEIDGVRCPHQYWVQVQLQLECCDLEECDFWQCKILEYKNKEEYIENYNKKEPFISKKTGFEHGAILQFMPNNDNEFQSVFVYPKKINMTTEDYEEWIKREKEKFNTEGLLNDTQGFPMPEKDEPQLPKAKRYTFYKVVWWYMVKADQLLIKRDREWFKAKLPVLEKTWSYVTYFRENDDNLKLWYKYICSQAKKNKTTIMDAADKLMHDNRRGSYAKRLTDSLREVVIKTEVAKPVIKQNRVIMPKKITKDNVCSLLNNDSDDD